MGCSKIIPYLPLTNGSIFYSISHGNECDKLEFLSESPNYYSKWTFLSNSSKSLRVLVLSIRTFCIISLCIIRIILGEDRRKCVKASHHIILERKFSELRIRMIRGYPGEEGDFRGKASTGKLSIWKERGSKGKGSPSDEAQCPSWP